MLAEIFKKSRTDKFTHGYGPIYEECLAPLKEESFQLCEIGVLRGESLRAWKEYFTSADIHGFDLLKFPKVDDIPVHKMDQCDKAEMIKLLNELEITPTVVIEDGGHKPEHHQKTLYAFFRALKSGGIYFIEDLQVCQAWFGGLTKYEVTDENNTITYLKQLLSENPMQSPYLTSEENTYLQENIESIEFRLNDKLAIIRKK